VSLQPSGAGVMPRQNHWQKDAIRVWHILGVIECRRLGTNGPGGKALAEPAAGTIAGRFAGSSLLGTGTAALSAFRAVAPALVPTASLRIDSATRGRLSTRIHHLATNGVGEN
jgi:hypothetical protein